MSDEEAHEAWRQWLYLINLRYCCLATLADAPPAANEDHR